MIRYISGNYKNVRKNFIIIKQVWSYMEQYKPWIEKQITSGHKKPDVIASLDYFLKHKVKFEDKHLENYDAKVLEDKIKEIEFSKISGLVEKLKEDKDYVLIHSDSEYNVFRIHTKKAVKKLGKGTQWCITMSDTSYFEDYSEECLFYFLIRKYRKNDKLDKIAAAYFISENRSEYYDQNDNLIRKKYYCKQIKKDLKNIDIGKYHKYLHYDIIIGLVE